MPMPDENEFGAPDQDTPEWTQEMGLRARRGAPWLWAQQDAVKALRDAAADLRERADRLSAEADRLEASS